MTGSRLATMAAFGCALALVVAVELVARRPGSRIPTLGEVCGFVLRYQVGRLPVGRIAVYGFWWWLGWHFFAR
jgi:hypothetical protein